MLTVEEYLNQLKTDKQVLVKNLKEKKIEASDKETFTTLVQKVKDISGGGGIEEYFNLDIPTDQYGAYAFKKYPAVNLGDRTSLYGFFKDMKYLEEIELIDTSKITSMVSAFQNCNALKTIPKFDTHNVKNMNDAFYMYGNRTPSMLTTIPLIDTSNVEYMSGTFSYCNHLTDMPLLNTAKVKNMSRMFYYCTRLKTIPKFDTSSVTNMSGMFEYSGIVDPSPLDCSHTQNLSRLFSHCYSLINIPLIDCSSATDISNIIMYCQFSKTLGGFKNLGKALDVSAPIGSFVLGLYNAYNQGFDEQSYKNVIDNLYDIKAKGCNSQKVIVQSGELKKISKEYIDLAASKGWVVTE